MKNCKKTISYLLIFCMLAVSLKGSKEEIVEAATHTHSDSCYEGTKHTHIGSSSSRGGCYQGSASYSTCGGTRTYSGVSEWITWTCRKCGYAPTYLSGYTPTLTHWDTGTQCNGSFSTSYSYTPNYSCNTCGYTSSSSGTCTATTTYYALNCGKTSGAYYNASGQLLSPICSQVVTSLSPIATSQSINADQLPNLTAIADFLDGSSSSVTCTASGLDMTNYNVAQTITLRYGVYSNTAKNKTPFSTTISVTVNGYFDLIVIPETDVKGYVTGSEMHVLCGTEKMVSAVANMGYSFEGWYDGEEKVSDEATYIFAMPAKELTLVAKFIPLPYNLSVYTITPNKGTVDVTGGSGLKPYTSDVSVHAIANTGYSFDGWYYNDTLVSLDSLYNFKMPLTDLILEGRFRTNYYNLNVDISDPIRGSVEVIGGSGSKLFESGVAVQATANTSYIFIGWYDGDTLVSTSSLYAFTMPPKDYILTAKFKQFTGVSVEFNNQFAEAYKKEPYYNGNGYDIKNNIILSKDMVNVYAYYDIGEREVVSKNDFSFINNKIYKVGINEITVQATISNLSLNGGGAEALGYYEDLSKSLDDIMKDLDITPGDYIGLKDAIIEMNSDLTLYRQTINAIKEKIELSIVDGTDADTLKSELAIVLNEVSRLYNRMNSLEAALDTAFKNYDVDLADANDIKTAILTLKNDLIEANLLIQSLQNEILMKTLTLEETELEIVKNQLLLDKIIVDNELLSSELIAMQDLKAFLEIDYQTKITLIEQLKLVIINNDTTINTLKDAVSSLSTDIQVTTSESSTIGVLKSELDKLQEEQENLKKRLLELQETYNSTLSLYDQLTIELNGLKSSEYLSNENIITMIQVNVLEQNVSVTKESSLELTTVLLMLEDANSRLSIENSKLLK